MSQTNNTKKKSNNSNKGRKRFNNKPYYSSGQNGKKKKKSRTLFVGKIYMKDIQKSEISSQLIQRRVDYLHSVLKSFGEVENITDYLENGHLFVTYKTRENAETALRKLRSRKENEIIMDNIRENLERNKLPSTVCPSLDRYKYDWSDKPSKLPKNAYSMKKQPVYQKEKIVKPKQNGEPPKKKNKKKTKKKPSYQKKENIEKKVDKKITPVEEKIIEKEVEKVVDADGLRREADKAKLKDELLYLATQLKNVESEIEAEGIRCKDRDVRILQLTEELRRVDLTKNRLERQLSNERRWKKLNQDTIVQLKQELEHLKQEQQSATLRLNQSDSIQPNQNDAVSYTDY